MEATAKQYWFMGACFGGRRSGDQCQRFVSDGIWEINNPAKKEIALVKSIRPGDRIAIKSTYTRKRGLPFDNRGETVSVMAIKATGTVQDNPGDGKQVKVQWDPRPEVREWYFYTYRSTIWRVEPGDWMADGLLSFAFDGTVQDLERFCNAPYWRNRFGTERPSDRRFTWSKFYEAVATKMLDHREDRAALVEYLKGISIRVKALGYLGKDQYKGGGSGFLRDICPFTTLGIFNRGITDANRKIIAGDLARFLGVQEPVPDTFEGIPVLNNFASWFFCFEKDRSDDHIEALWDIFAAALAFADSDDEAGDDETRCLDFVKAYDQVNGRPGVGWNLTIGLYWARPWSFPTLDDRSRSYISKKLSIPMGPFQGPNGRCNADEYLEVISTLDSHFLENSYPVHSYPDLSHAAWLFTRNEEVFPTRDDGAFPVGNEVEEDADAAASIPPSIVPYGVDDIVREGCFLDRDEVERLIELLESKKNLIIQGPPGTGKTWLAKRLAFALMKQKDETKVRAVQFHPNLSYEDFVRGWRPTGVDGKLAMADGVFMESINDAKKHHKSKIVVIIEEINRGNPAHIFGELLTLLEAGKRNPDEALELCYPDADGVRRPVHVPKNLFVIGTMNVADRSLALVDMALRRRFAFANLKPTLGALWRDWVVKECNLEPGLVTEIEKRMESLNEQIAADPRLGKQFRIGHSYVTPDDPIEPGETRKWFIRVVENEITPLLEEYWFDAPKEAEQARERLLLNI